MARLTKDPLGIATATISPFHSLSIFSGCVAIGFQPVTCGEVHSRSAGWRSLRTLCGGSKILCLAAKKMPPNA